MKKTGAGAGAGAGLGWYGNWGVGLVKSEDPIIPSPKGRRLRIFNFFCYRQGEHQCERPEVRFSHLIQLFKGTALTVSYARELNIYIYVYYIHFVRRGSTVSTSLAHWHGQVEEKDPIP
ncbi:hypothetical protein VFPPC_16059 [Pochonia chlamydosporia 170]|uniref:Uncharacterized protein n=1 Tax=Pochonia chlamydosporia 170 TaxID=1380566 RepID=A0A179FNK4_METCM|nr:hypothetical protein VFPPC_16059 [Pochonia chlamydosporia 170]OAQ66721.1 hypothetical protein VFPPC_16059 [Pochonia chlamydosporia 170]